MYNIMKNGSHSQYGTYDLIADFSSDIAAAPTDIAPGSKMFCIENSVTYILSSEKEWVEYSTGGSSKGGGGCDHENFETELF